MIMGHAYPLAKFGTMKARIGVTHFHTKTLPK
jgi:hypothetical protein